MIALEARGLVVEVGGKIVVDDLTFDLRAGDKIGVVGRNGAGKTSTMTVLAGEEEPAGGSIVPSDCDSVASVARRPNKRRETSKSASSSTTSRTAT